MATREEKIVLLRYIGLTDQKIEETIKNETLTNLLVEIINHVAKLNSFKCLLSLFKRNFLLFERARPCLKIKKLALRSLLVRCSIRLRAK